MTKPFPDWRSNPLELERTRDLLNLMPSGGENALDVGARDCYLSTLLTERFMHVVALDLEKPEIDHPKISPVQGDASKLGFADNSFDLVVCAEVLEHIPPNLLARVCDEICRVANHTVVIGVPFKQDIRCSRTTCQNCGHINPPWGHVNSFDKQRLISLFAGLTLTGESFVGSTKEMTNPLSAALMNLAGNPYGTYEQDEHCIWCNSQIKRPMEQGIPQKIAAKLALTLDRCQAALNAPRAKWIHLRFSKHP